MGGPTTAGSGVAHEGYHDFTGLINRDHDQDDWVKQRKQPSESLGSPAQPPSRPQPTRVSVSEAAGGRLPDQRTQPSESPATPAQPPSRPQPTRTSIADVAPARPAVGQKE